MNKPKAIIFDVDGTLTEHNSWYKLTHDLGASKDHHTSIYSDFYEGQITYEEANKKILSIWQNTGNASKKKIEEIYEQWPVRTEAYTLIDWLKAEDYLICLITGATDLYAKSVAKALGIKSYYANAGFGFDNNDNLTDWHYDADQASVKLSQLEEYCRDNKINPEDCIAIGDSSNDLELFKATKHGILLNNEHAKDELKNAAWRIVETLDEVKQIIAI